MKRIKQNMVLFALITVMTLFLGACRTTQPISTEQSLMGPTEALYLQGDLQEWGDVSVLWSEQVTSPITAYDKTVPGVLLEDLLARAGMIFEENDVYLIADDGFMVKLDVATITETYVAYFNDLGWCYISSKHPVNSAIKHMRYMVVVGKDIETSPLNDRGLGFNLIVEGHDVWYSRGQLLMMNDVILNKSDGESILGNLSIDVMKQHKCLQLSDLLEEDVTLLLMTNDGDQRYIYEDYGYLEVAEDYLTYYSRDGADVYYQVVGAVVDPPGASNRDNYYDAEHYLRQGVPVMTIFLDGFSYKQYLYIKNQTPKTYLASLTQVDPAMTVVKPVTNAGFAAMITGQLPTVSGIHDRSHREPEVNTIFDLAETLGLSHQLIEGDIGILNLSTETQLNLDENGDGLTDDEIADSAMKEVNKGFDYLMVHFHSIDDRGHAYGPYGAETIDQIHVVEGYVQALVEAWQGMVIITADHGMHEDGDGGDHGLMVTEDITVPYMVIDRR